MKEQGLKGVVRGRKCYATVADDTQARPLDLVNREFTATRPNELWVADLTPCCHLARFVYVAFVIVVFAAIAAFMTPFQCFVLSGSVPIQEYLEFRLAWPDCDDRHPARARGAAVLVLAIIAVSIGSASGDARLEHALAGALAYMIARKTLLASAELVGAAAERLSLPPGSVSAPTIRR